MPLTKQYSCFPFLFLPRTQGEPARRREERQQEDVTERWWATNLKENVSSCVLWCFVVERSPWYSCTLGAVMLGGMEEDPEVGDRSLAKLAGLDFGLPSNEDTVSCKLHQLLLLALLFSGFNNLVSFPCLGFQFCATGDGARGHRICLSEKIWSFVVLWTVFLIFLGMLLCVFCGRFRPNGQSVCGEGLWLWLGVTFFWDFSIDQCWDS
jgi:hypothetical protein